MPQASASAAVVHEESSSFGSMTSIRLFAIKFWSEALIIIVAVLLWIPRFSGPIDLRWDASVYYLLGTSLTKGHGYRIESEPGAPAALQYPPLLPAIISLHQRALDTTDPTVVAPWLRITYAVLFLIYAVAALRLAKRYLRPAFATMATLLCLLNPVTIFFSDLLFAEVPFALISVLFALVAGAASLRGRQWSHELRSFALAASGFLLRSAGLVLLAAWMLDAMMRRRWRLFCARALISLVPVVGWQAYVSHVRSSPEYSHLAYEYQRAAYQYYNVSYLENMRLIDPFRPELGTLNARAFVSRLGTNLGTVPGAMGEIVTAKEKDWRGTALWLQGLVSNYRLFPISLVRAPIFALASLVIAGLVVFLRRGEWIMTFIIAGSFALVCLTPWPGQFTRYLEPLAPFLTIAAVLGVVEISGILARRMSTQAALVVRWSAILLLLLAIIVELHTAAWLFSERARQRVVLARNKTVAAPKWFLYDPPWQAWQEAVNWIDSHAAPNAIVATSAPHFYYLQTGRLAVLPPMTIDPARERHLLEAVPVSYVIIDELEFLDIARRYALPAIESDPARWRLLHSIGNTHIYGHSNLVP
jgi:hypothetical protein